MTDTGQIPGEGQPESAGMVEQPGAPAHGYTYVAEAPAGDEDLLLPGAQGAWGNEVPPPAPEPVVEAVHQPGAHEASGRDSGQVDLTGVRLPEAGPVSVTPSPILSAPHGPSVQPPRRPLHLGPPIPDTSASPVRSLADRGPAGAPVRQPVQPVAGPEYAEAPHLHEAVPQGTGQWNVAAAVSPPTAETVGPVPGTAPDPAQAAMARMATQATGVVHAHDGVQPVDGHDGVYEVAAAEAVPAEAGVVTEAVVPPAESAVVAPEPEAVVPSAEEPQEAAPAVAVVGAPAEQVEQVEPATPEVAASAAAEPVAAEAAAAIPAQAAAPVEPDPQADLVVTADPEQAPAPDAAQQAAAPAEGEPHAAAPAEPDLHAVAPAEGEPQAVAPAEPDPHAAVPAAADPAQVPVPDPAQPQAAAEAEPQAPAPADADPQVAALAEADPQAAVLAEVDPQAGALAGADPQVAALAEADPQAAVPAEAEPLGAAPVEADPAQVPVPDAAQPEAVAPAEATVPDAALPAQPEPQAATPADADPQGAAPAEPAVPAAAEATPEAPEPVPAPEAEAEAETPAPAEPAPVADEAPVPTQGPQLVAPPEAAAPPEATPLPSAVPLEPHPDQTLGQFVPVDGQVPTAPHLAPTPPQPLRLPEQLTEEPDLVQSAEDLDTRAADQDEQDATAVAEAPAPAGPAAPAYNDAEREAVLKVIRERRDIRNGFRSDPIPHEVLLRVLEAAHTAPSVGHSQPWDFVVIKSAETRRAMHDLAMSQREAYAKSLPKGRAKQFKEMKIEAILDTPVNIVVTADPTRGGRHTLGRHTQPQMAPYSSALAVENLWLAARAEGLGVGWVSFFDEREMVRALGLPEHLEVVAYLCVGYVDEFPDEPELMQAGWSKRRPLSWVVHEETYGRRALPGEEPHDLLAETVAQIRPLDAKALGEAWERQKRMTKPAGALGMLEIISAQLSGLSRQCPPPIPEPAAVAIFAGDHGVHAQGVTPWPQEVTGQMVANFLGGGAVCNAFASQVGAEVCVVDVGVVADLPATPGLLPRKIRGGTSDMTAGPAMTREEARVAIEVGIETARDLVAAGNKALLTGEMGIANTTASAALIAAFTGADPAEVTGRGTGINDETLARKTEVVRRALELHQPDPADPIGVLAAVGGFEHAAMVGLLLGGASLRTPVILDGVSAGAAALVARAIAPEVLAACIAGHRSAEPGHVAALNKLGLRPLVDLDLRLGEGTGALLALPLVQSTARAMHEVATFDSAGVTEK
ncbi:nicotinate-nucleotide--dimethylbenzimidazole phosphoribosyltransferase [Streptomyces sp. LaPpAH-108]|uniref:nicotinate-nucleotide--dimethylbenzimidazole phosphoribosyltransferase n=1 Tax=Streptomyces sp. LaPpAH-108 TaxID=1155714 RepID=UPI0003828D2C|nr:nicotinate-nucleotide--dimethylbenzimidazole phosphoribosyltransferase [Streptomyces sp. LaPpAH-108]